MPRLKQLYNSNLFVLTCIVLLGLTLRLYLITNPVLDWHAFRQADTASVTRWYVQHGIDLLQPKYDDLSNIASGLDNPEGYRMVEFPFVNAAIALIAKVTFTQDVVLLSRLSSVVASLGSIILIFYLVNAISGRNVGLAAATALAVMPYSVFYSRVILPEPFLVFFLLGALTAWWHYLRTQSRLSLISAVISLALALLLKPFALFIYPVLAAMAWVTWGVTSWKKPSLWIITILPLAPLLVWRQWIEQFPSGIPANSWLFNSNDIRLKPAWVRWLGYERLIRLIVGMVGSLFLLSSVFSLKRQEAFIYGSWWLGMLLYLIIIATGNVQHDYYQVLLTPIIAITLGRGAIELYRMLRHPTPMWNIIVLIAGVTMVIGYGLTLVMMIQPSAFYPERLTTDFIISSTIMVLFLGWLVISRNWRVSKGLAVAIVAMLAVSAWSISASYIKEYYNVNHWEYLHVGKQAQTILPETAKVIAPANGDTMFLYQLNRPGWALGFEIDKKIELGATHYISTNYDDEARELESRFSTIEKTDQYILLDLQQPLTSSAAATPASL